MSLWMAKDYINKALNRWDLEDGKHWAREALKEIEKSEAENKQLKEALEYAHCQLQNINAIRRALNKFEVNLEIIEQALKGIIMSGKKVKDE